MSGLVQKPIESLANHLMLARSPDEKVWGRAVFLVGAGCSQSAGIPLAAEVAQHCAQHLACSYSENATEGLSPDDAFRWLLDASKIPPDFGNIQEKEKLWKDLYPYFFDEHIVSLNLQREIIKKSVDKARGLNWAHACLGELVKRRYIHTVLTTNFDQLVLQGIIRTGLLPVVADGIEALNMITAQPGHPQIVHLHGSMHAYKLRNSRKATEETRSDTALQSLLYNVLLQSHLLVVVGYAGGERGVMNVLQDAAMKQPGLMIFWIAYDLDEARLSEQASMLLRTGDNKFLIAGHDADRFFQQLMKLMNIGVPEWIKDPISILVEFEKSFVPLDTDPDIKVAADGFRRRVSWAADHRMPEDDLKERFARLRLKGDDKEVFKEITSLEGETNDPELLRMRAQSAYAVAANNMDPHALETAIDGFTQLIKITQGERQASGFVDLLKALFLSYDITKSIENLTRMLEISEQALQSFPRETNPEDWATFQLYRAQALQTIGEESKNTEKLREAVAAYHLALEELARAPRDARWIDVRAGLATALQALGEMTNDVDLVKKAVEELRTLVSIPVRSGDPLDRAGRLSNFAGGLIALADMDNDHSVEFLQDARQCLKEVVAIYEPRGELSQLDAARRDLAAVDERLRSKVE